MKNEKKLSALILALLCIGLISGCSKDSQPVSSDPLSQVSLAGSVTSTTTTGMPGIDLRNSKGVFSVDWRRVFHSKQQTTDTTGSAFAIGTDSVRIGLMSTIFIGVDMGKVTLSYGSDSIHLKKVTSFGGRVFYSTAWGWDRDFDDAAKTNVGFVPGGQYQFDVSGSTSFAALTAVVPAPPALVLVSSPAAGDTADITKDLTVSWTGGSSTSSILLRVIPIYKFGHPEIAVHNDGDDQPNALSGPAATIDDGHGNDDHGRDHDGGECHIFPPPPRDTVISVWLSSNPGTYTIPSSQLQQYANSHYVKEFRITVREFNMTDIDHDGGKVHIIFHDGDGIWLNIK